VERIVIIGGGGTGAALAHDLSLRGFEVVVVEKGSLLSGTSGRHHGLLHSGARYVLHDIETAGECYTENQTLRRLAPQAVEANDGLFVALNDRDMDLRSAFIERCAEAGIPTRPLTAGEARSLEPGLTGSAKAAVQVPDAGMDAWRLPLHFFATAHANGATIRPFTRVDALIVKVDMRSFFLEFDEGWSGIKPIKTDTPHRTPHGVNQLTQFENCIECGCCVSACPLMPESEGFMGPAVLAALKNQLSKDPDRRSILLEKAAGFRGANRCRRHLTCSRVCPSEVNPARHIADLQRAIGKLY
jgi:ferredoxin